MITGEGGSIPVVGDFQRILSAPVLLVGFGLPGENAHAPNEWMSEENFYKGMRAMAALWDELRASAQAQPTSPATRPRTATPSARTLRTPVTVAIRLRRQRRLAQHDSRLDARVNRQPSAVRCSIADAEAVRPAPARDERPRVDVLARLELRLRDEVADAAADPISPGTSPGVMLNTSVPNARPACTST